MIRRYEEIIDYAKRVAIQVDKHEYKEAIEEFMQTVEDGEEVEGVAAYKYGEKQGLLSLHGVDWERVAHAIFTKRNAKACMIIECVNHMIGNETRPWHKEEYYALNAFNDKVKAFAKEHGELPRVMLIKGMVKVINRFLKTNGWV